LSKLKQIFGVFTLSDFRKSWSVVRNTLCTLSRNSQFFSCLSFPGTAIQQPVECLVNWLRAGAI